jgi:hypothetical protein
MIGIRLNKLKSCCRPRGQKSSTLRAEEPLQGLDIGRDRDGLNVFEVLIPGALSPGQELLDCPVIGSSGVSVPDRDCKKLEELFPG